MTLSNNNDYILELKNIKKSFEGLKVIENISITLSPFELVSIVGPSGCGKTTLFNIIAGITKASEGDIYINGRIESNLVGQISYMTQKDLLLPWKKLIDNVALPLIINGTSKKNARQMVLPYFEEFGLFDFEYKYPYQLSGGMRQRASFLRTIIQNKDIILLDEPFASLDEITKCSLHQWFLDKVKSLKKTVLLITHDINEAIKLSDKIYVVSQKPSTVLSEISSIDKSNHELLKKTILDLL